MAPATTIVSVSALDTRGRVRRVVVATNELVKSVLREMDVSSSSLMAEREDGVRMETEVR